MLATGLAFILLALKYVEVAARYPDGGGVVSVATDAFGPRVGCLGGILICIDYFLTGAISSVSGFQYLAGLFPALDHWSSPGACGAIVLLGAAELVGIRESAMLTAFLAVASFVGEPGGAGGGGGAAGRRAVAPGAGRSSRRPARCRPGRSWWGSPAPGWPFPGLESISQIAPGPARARASGPPCKAMMLVMAAILLTSPLITAFETALLEVHGSTPSASCSSWGRRSGRAALQLAIVLTAAALLMGAANTAIIGCYHVFLALVRLGFMPHWLAERSRRFNTPHRAIVISVLVPVRGHHGQPGPDRAARAHVRLRPAGGLHLTSVGLDRIRWQERKLGAGVLPGPAHLAAGGRPPGR